MTDVDPDALEWDLDERDRFMAEHGEEDTEPDTEIVVETDE
jgi:hypothetical protein